MRSAAIKGENGEVLFEQTNCEVPSFWSQLATNVICSKYFYGEVGTPEREYSVRQLVHRVGGQPPCQRGQVGVDQVVAGHGDPSSSLVIAAANSRQFARSAANRRRPAAVSR